MREGVQQEKVQFTRPCEEHGSHSEHMWCERVDGAIYRVANIPTFMHGLSLNDLVRTRKTKFGRKFVDIVHHCGHSTFQLVIPGSTPSTETEEFRRYWRALEALGCGRESIRHKVGVDVPPGVDVRKVRLALSMGATAGVWDFEEAHCEHSSAMSQAS